MRVQLHILKYTFIIYNTDATCLSLCSTHFLSHFMSLAQHIWINIFAQHIPIVKSSLTLQQSENLFFAYPILGIWAQSMLVLILIQFKWDNSWKMSEWDITLGQVWGNVTGRNNRHILVSAYRVDWTLLFQLIWWQEIKSFIKYNSGFLFLFLFLWHDDKLMYCRTHEKRMLPFSPSTFLSSYSKAEKKKNPTHFSVQWIWSAVKEIRESILGPRCNVTAWPWCLKKVRRPLFQLLWSRCVDVYN